MNDCKELFHKAEELKRRGLLDDAIALYKKILTIDADYKDVYSILGEVYYIKGDVGESIKHFELQLKKNPDNKLDSYRLGIAYFRATKFSQCIKILKGLVEDGCQLDMAYYWIGLAYFHTGRIPKSIEMFEMLRHKMPHNTVGCYDLAIAYKTIGDYEKAITKFKLILEEDDSIVSVHFQLALTYLDSLNLSEAIKHLKQVVELDHKHKAAQKKLDDIFNDQEMLYSYGIAAPKDISNSRELNINFHIGEAYKGFNMIDKTFKYLKSLAVEKDKKE
jgi:tetratricopeptide (TPR) repeat protein